MTDKTFPALGHVYKADYGDLVFRVAFASEGNSLRWAPFAATDFNAEAKSETYRATFIRTGVFMVTWKEADGITVTHVEDFENSVVHAAITLADRKFLTLKGHWTRLAE
ncbi:MoaF-related domain-containing protein [Neorhizobium tomejilense]|uniref:MoaF-related domain-containing protein n=1 Tax=Neorhizobium tomejilense TaxID=2093828 RepID=UPI003ECFE220